MEPYSDVGLLVSRGISEINSKIFLEDYCYKPKIISTGNFKKFIVRYIKAISDFERR